MTSSSRGHFYCLVAAVDFGLGCSNGSASNSNAGHPEENEGGGNAQFPIEYRVYASLPRIEQE